MGGRWGPEASPSVSQEGLSPGPGSDSHGDGDPGSLLGDHLWQRFPNVHMLHGHGGLIRTDSWAPPPPGIPMQEVRWVPF